MKAPSSYQEMLEMAGLTVVAFEQFGSYQGDWIAKVKMENGSYGFIHSYYGSCSGCDALQAEFGWSYGENVPLEKVLNFASSYIKDVEDYESVLKDVSSNLEWDMEAQQMIDWLELNK